ncbi:MAG: TSUP family transporter [Clostridia bacterium]|nr:TSUP family transporter [Clostridia bacterium]
MRAIQASSTRALLLAVLSFLAGVLNGLLGTGGGMILLFTLGALLPREQAKECFVISTVGVLVFSAISTLFYTRGGSISLSLLPRFALPAAAGGLAGALLLNKVSVRLLRKIFAALLVYSGVKLLGVI